MVGPEVVFYLVPRTMIDITFYGASLGLVSFPFGRRIRVASPHPRGGIDTCLGGIQGLGSRGMIGVRDQEATELLRSFSLLANGLLIPTSIQPDR